MMGPALNRKVILLIKGANALVVNDIVNAENTQNFSYDGTIFTVLVDEFQKNNFGFYDWLRNSNRVIVGLRLGFFEKIPNWLQESYTPNVVIDEGRLRAAVFFESNREFDDAQSDDQILGDIRLFSAIDGSIALALY
jgi:hypothetical protein